MQSNKSKAPGVTFVHPLAYRNDSSDDDFDYTSRANNGQNNTDSKTRLLQSSSSSSLLSNGDAVVAKNENENNNNDVENTRPKPPPRTTKPVLKQQQPQQLTTVKTQINADEPKIIKNITTFKLNENNQFDSNNNLNYCQTQFVDNQKKLLLEMSQLQPSQVRWLYKEDPKSSTWTTFNGLDSLNLEIEYLLFKKSNYDNTYKCQPVQVLNRLFEVDINERICKPIYWEGSSMQVMRGTWFNSPSWEPLDEDIADRIELEHVNKFKENLIMRLSPDKLSSNNIANTATVNVSNEEKELVSINVNSGSNSNATSPTSEKEPDNKNGSSNNTTKDSKSKTQNEPVYSIIVKDLTCYWYSPDEVYLAKNKTLINTLGLSFGKQKSGNRIMRGYKIAADSEDNSGDITHLVFVVHGIAQKLYEKSIIKNCDDLRKGCETMKAKFLQDTAKKGSRVEFIPVDWRSSLTLDAGIVESITPQSIKFIRDKLNSSALDIMYYTSPLFRYEIMNGLCSEVNRLYALFCEKNPYFKAKNGKISVIAHSLGSVIFYDILTHNNSYIQLTNNYGEDINQETKMFNHFSNNNATLLEEYLSSKKRIQEIEEKLLKSNQNLTLLDFSTENLFCLGSPLAVFLALRGVRPAGNGLQDHILPKHLCKNLFNLFHPYDAIAYRLEPLILKHYSTIMPIEVHNSSDSTNAKHVPYEEMKNKAIKSDVELAGTVKESGNTSSGLSFNFLRSKKNVDYTPITDLLESNDQQQNNSSSFTNLSNLNTNSNGKNDNNVFDQVDLEKRIDYQLPTSIFQLTSPLTSHTSYWNSSDVALFIISKLVSNE